MLRRGSRGDDVTWLQGLLNKIRRGGDRHLKVDGIFGGNTKERVKETQQRYGLSQDGIVGPNTFNVLLALQDPDGYGRDVGITPEGTPARTPTGDTTGGRTGAGPLVTPGTPTSPPIPKPKHLSEAEVREVMRASLSPQGWRWVAQSRHGKTLIFWLSRLGDVGKIANACGALDGVIVGSGGAALGPLIGMISGFLFPIGATLSWLKAVETNERHYGWLASCYAATHWIFSDSPGQRMTRSKEGRARHDWLREADGMAKLDVAWRTAWDEQMARMNRLDLKGVSKAHYRETVRLLYGNDAGAFCKELQIALEPRTHSTFGGLGSAGGGIELDNWRNFHNVNYPD